MANPFWTNIRNDPDMFQLLIPAQPNVVFLLVHGLRLFAALGLRHGPGFMVSAWVNAHSHAPLDLLSMAFVGVPHPFSW